MGRKQSRTARWRPMHIAMAAVTVVILVTAALAIVVAVNWFRLRGAVAEVAAATIGESPTVATILATRDAIRDVAKAQGAPRAVVFAAIERRTTDEGQTVHVAAFYLCARFCHPEFERTLPRSLSPDELQALHRERIHEHSGPGRRWTHHHH